MKHGWAFLFFMPLASFAQADIYKNVDDTGHVTYSNLPSKGAKKISIEPLTTMPKAAREPSQSTSSEYRVDGQTQKHRDDTRRRILDDELAQEELRLQASKSALAQGGGEEKIRKIREDIAQHEKNIDALIHEISNLK